MNRRAFLLAGLTLPAWGVSPVLAKARPNQDVDNVDPAALDELLALVLPGLDGKAQPLGARSQNRIAVVNFWASWCAPCVREMPALDQLQKKYGDVVQVLGVGLDTENNIRAFAEKTPVAYPLLLAGAGKISLMRKLGNPKGGLPYTLVLDRKGGPAATILGEIDIEALQAFLDGQV